MFAVQGRDDLRQDAIMQQVFSLVNRLLSRDPAASSRQLHIRTYKVSYGLDYINYSLRPATMQVLSGWYKTYQKTRRWAMANLQIKINEIKDSVKQGSWPNGLTCYTVTQWKMLACIWFMFATVCRTFSVLPSQCLCRPVSACLVKYCSALCNNNHITMNTYLHVFSYEQKSLRVRLETKDNN